MSKIKVPNIAGEMVAVDMPRRGAAWRLMRFWSVEQQARVHLDPAHALIVQALITGRAVGDGSLREAGDIALDQLLTEGWTPATLSATALAFVEQVPVVYPPVGATADFSKAQPDPKTST